MSETIESRIRQSFQKQSMMQTLGVEIDMIEKGVVTLSAPILESSRQQHGVAHAALTFALGDTAAGYAALSVMEEDSEVMTAEIKINLLASGQGDRLVARGKVLKRGRRLVVVSADVFARTGDREVLIAVLQGTMIPV
ncbi:PaaI family thioesterase [Aliisedimentitalea scapharcae]|uniref:PaaI family thioesterase n=2 Tax=Aliisedimentitalea scapharcae TaxID=1524259 RepID=A0ABZ2XWK3_9RHOB